VAFHHLLGFACVPDLILGTGPGDLFITRNAGNVVPVSGNDVDGCSATIEYAIEVLKVRSAILCGHSDCGALKAAIDRKCLESLPKARRWLSHVEGAFTHRQPFNPADGEQAELAALIRGNVVAQLLRGWLPEAGAQRSWRKLKAGHQQRLTEKTAGESRRVGRQSGQRVKPAVRAVEGSLDAPEDKSRRKSEVVNWEIPEDARAG